MAKRMIILAPALAFVVAMSVGSAARADRVYHSHHYPLLPVGGAPLRSGYVENIHANGPNVYAHEVYALNGADANASYPVSLSIWTSNTWCAGTPDLQLSTAAVTTNDAGNGLAQAVFTPEQAGELRGHTVSAMWTLLGGASPAYQTGCEVLVLD
jgi:hypothetical protein